MRYTDKSLISILMYLVHCRGEHIIKEFTVCHLLYFFICIMYSCSNNEMEYMYIKVQEQDKSSDIEQQPPFGDRKISNIQPQNRGGGVTKPTGISYNFDKV